MRRVGRALRPAVIPILAVITAFIVGSFFILITDFDNLSKLGKDPVGAITGALGTIGTAYYSMLIGALGDPAKLGAAISNPTPRAMAAAIRPITETLVASTPLIFAGLATAISFRSGVFNIGVEGQFVLGAFGATVAAITLKDEPMALIYDYGKGRVFQTMLGHDAGAIRNPSAAELIRRGCTWVARREQRQVAE